MNIEELIDRLLDGTLSDSELRQLESQMISDDIVSNEVRELLHLEEAMNKSANVHFEASEAYRQDVADLVKEKMRAETGTVFNSGRISSTLWSVGSLLRGKAAIGAGALIVAAMIVPLEFGSDIAELGNAESFQNTQPITEFVAQDDMQSIPPVGGTLIEPELTIDDENFDDAEIASTVPAVESTPALEDAALSIPDTETDQPLDNRIAEIEEQDNSGVKILGVTAAPSSKQKRYEAQASELRDEMNELEANGNTLKAIQIRKQLAVVYRGAGMYPESAQSLNQVVAVARAKGIRDLEASALGELGLLEREFGNLGQARLHLQKCVEIKSTDGANDLERWQRELSTLPE